MVVVSPSRALRAKISLISAPLHTAALAFWNHPRLAQIYPQYLFHTHAIVRASVPLMKAALDRALTFSKSDPVAVAWPTICRNTFQRRRITTTGCSMTSPFWGWIAPNS